MEKIEMNDLCSQFISSKTTFKKEVVGISFEQLEKYANSIEYCVSNFYDKKYKNYYIPGFQLLSKIRPVAQMIYQENNTFPFKILKNVGGSYINKHENRLYLDEKIIYKFIYLSFTKDKILFDLKIKRIIDKKLILSGHFYLS